MRELEIVRLLAPDLGLTEVGNNHPLEMHLIAQERLDLPRRMLYRDLHHTVVAAIDVVIFNLTKEVRLAAVDGHRLVGEVDSDQTELLAAAVSNTSGEPITRKRNGARQLQHTKVRGV